MGFNKRFSLWRVVALMMVAALSPTSAFAADSLTTGEGGNPQYVQGKTSLSTQAQHSIPGWKGSLFSKKSSTYSNALALKAAEMSENAYGEHSGSDNSNIKRMIGYYGFTDFKSYNYMFNYQSNGKMTTGSNNSAFTVGHDKLRVGNQAYMILVVVARGTISGDERIGDLNLFDITRKLNGCKVRKNDYDFYSEINKGVEDYIKNHKAVSSAAKKGKLKVLITGHSLGGAAANLYAAHLDNAATKSGSAWKNHLEKDDIYAYTFGAIKVFANNSNVEFGYENIHNVYNYYDSFGPHGPKEWLHISDPKAKFGHTDMFNIGKIEEGDNLLDEVHNHNMSRYIEALKAKKVSCSGKQQFKVVFKPNKGLGTMTSQLMDRNKKTALHPVTYQRAGYKFTGWNTKKDGKGGAYKDKEKVRDLAKAGKTVKLYAQWKKKSNGKVTMWVVTKVKEGKPVSWTLNYDYTKNGLLSKRSCKESNGDKFLDVYKYDARNRLKSFTPTLNGEILMGEGEGKTLYQHNKKGYVIKAICAGEPDISFKYDGKGRLLSENYAYDANGHVKTEKYYDGDDGFTTTWQYRYDSHGNLSWFSYKGYGKANKKLKNKYKGGLLRKTQRPVVFYDTGAKLVPVAYSYKKVSVPKSLVNMVKAQQDSIINGILPIAAAHN